LAFAARLPVGLAEQLQKAALPDLRIRQLLRCKSKGHFLEKGLSPSGDRDPVEKLFRIEPARKSMREIGFVVQVPLIGTGAQLIRSRADDCPDQMPQIVFMIDKILRERIQQLWI